MFHIDVHGAKAQAKMRKVMYDDGVLKPDWIICLKGMHC
jgi:hypothetical protein